MDLYFLGTGAGVPSKNRNVSGIALQLLQERGTVWLFDCGEATQHQILHTTIKPRKVEKIFITHLHGDHIFGLPGFLSSRSFQGGTEDLEIYGPAGLESFVKTSIKISQTHLTYNIKFFEVEDGILFEDDSFRVYAKKLQHGIPSYGYRVEEKDKVGELMPEKLKSFGIQPGPIYKQIKEQDQFQLPDGSIIFRDDVVGPPKKGKIVSILGDTRYTEEHVPFLINSDVLVHEATFGSADENLAYEYFHSSANQAAKLAHAAGVKKLLLTHISSRYQQHDLAPILKDAQQIFSNLKIVQDFDQINI